MKYSKFNFRNNIFFKNTTLFFLTTLLFASFSCQGQNKNNTLLIKEITTEIPKKIITAANLTEKYFPLLENKRIGIVANQTSVIFKPYQQEVVGEFYNPSDSLWYQGVESHWFYDQYTHLVDSLVSSKINVIKVFAPEHGFRGTADAGEIIKDGKDLKTGLPLVSLYGNNKKPTQAQLADLDMVIFDIQDVGARFYTYISTLHYVMEACAEAGIPLLILDRPNPNIHYTDGPILEKEHSSFVGMHPIPIVHGMTIAEYAQMINGEGWLENGLKCTLHIIPVSNYSRADSYSLPIKPSPNLPNDQSINLYPSTCFFEGTPLSEGRGTEKQFQVFGSPDLPKDKYPFSFTPQPNEGAKNPKLNGILCYGMDLSTVENLDGLNLDWLINAYQNFKDKDSFFTSFFTTLAGTKKLQTQIQAGMSAQDIKATWQDGLQKYNDMRQKYLLYK